MRSLVTSNRRPTSSRCVRVRLPDRIATSELSVLSRSMYPALPPVVLSASKAAASAGAGTSSSGISPAQMAVLLLLRSVFPAIPAPTRLERLPHLSTEISISAAISSGVGSLPSSCRSWREMRIRFIDRLHHMHGNSDRSRLIGDRSRDRLGIHQVAGAELISFSPIRTCPPL